MIRTLIGGEVISLEQAKSHLNVPHSLDDDYIITLISVARNYIENKTSQVIVHSSYTGVVDEKIFPIISNDLLGNIEAGYADTDTIPKVLIHSMLLLIFNLYTERNISVKKFPDSIDYLINYEKKYGYCV